MASRRMHLSLTAAARRSAGVAAVVDDRRLPDRVSMSADLRVPSDAARRGNDLRRFAVWGALTALLSGLLGTDVSAALFVVDTFEDSIDVAVGDGVCSDAAGRCSLRAAIMEANALPGGDEVWLPLGSSPGEVSYYIDLSQPDLDDSAATGDLDVHDDLILRRHPNDGPRIAQIGTLSDTFATPGRIFDLHPPARVQMADLAFSFGYLSDPQSFGAGMYVRAGAEAELERCVFYANSGSARGVALAVQGRATLRGCLIFDNGTGETPETVYVGPGAQLTIEQSTLSGNSGDRELLVEGAQAELELRRAWLDTALPVLLRDGAVGLLENVTITSGRLAVQEGADLSLLHVTSLGGGFASDGGPTRLRIGNSAWMAGHGCVGPAQSLTSLGGNVMVGAAPCAMTLHASDRQTQDLRLIEVQGPVPTEPSIVMPGLEMRAWTPLPASPLLDAALPEHCPALDQIGAPRPDVGATVPRCDSGAMEGPMNSIFADGFGRHGTVGL